MAIELLGLPSSNSRRWSTDYTPTKGVRGRSTACASSTRSRPLLHRHRAQYTTGRARHSRTMIVRNPAEELLKMSCSSSDNGEIALHTGSTHPTAEIDRQFNYLFILNLDVSVVTQSGADL